MNPLITVIIPHFERSDLLRSSVESVLLSSERRFEIVIVDDGSSPEELKRVNDLASERIRVIRREGGEKGPSRCRNIGVAASTAEYLVFLDSDDIMTPWCLETRLKAAIDQPDAGMWVFPVLLFRDHPGDSDLLWNRMATGKDDATRFASSDPPWHTSSPIWKKGALLAFGGFNERVFYGDDSDLHLRALLSGVTTRQYPDALPDIFVRRSDAPRITNSLSDALVESRRTRLREGTGFLKKTPGGALQLVHWEGEYFAEAEFLLFNHAEPRHAVEKVLEAWEEQFTPTRSLKRIVRSYFAVALASHQRAYLLLRVARRLVMRMLPPVFFAVGADSAPIVASEAVLSEVQRRMSVHQVTTK